jgi:hypothetical protein
MAWGRIDDGAFTHPKFLTLDPAALGLWAMALSYSAHELTDGFIPREQVPRLVSVGRARAFALAAKLVASRLWEDRGADGFQVHDYLDWNDSAKEVREKRAAIAEVRSRAGRLGGLRSAEVNRSKRQANPVINAEANAGGLLAKQTQQNSSPRHATPLTTEPKTLDDGGLHLPKEAAEWVHADGCVKTEHLGRFPADRRRQCREHRAVEAESGAAR